MLEGLGFKCKIPELGAARLKSARSKRTSSNSRITNYESRITVQAPAHRLDIGEGIVGLADVLEEVARVYGYDRLPSTNMADTLPPQGGNPGYEWEEGLRDLLVAVGFSEVGS